MRFVLVTGTSTGVGKTVVTAALACVWQRADRVVTVVKPVQTGIESDERTDIAVAGELSGCTRLHQLVGLPDPLAPDTAARRRGIEVPTAAEHAQECVKVAADSDIVLVEGAGGVLVRLDTQGGTLLDLGRALADAGHDVEVVVVTTLALGTLNHTELTVRAITDAGLGVTGIVIGSEPPELGLAERCNIDDLPRVTGVPILGAVPAGAGNMRPDLFQAAAPVWLPNLVPA